MFSGILGNEEFKFGSGKYFQFPGALFLAGKEARHFGKKAYIIGGNTALNLVASELESCLSDEGVAYTKEYYSGVPSMAKIHRLQDSIKNSSCEIVIAVGGGRVIDLAKAAAESMLLPIITIPTSAATCAAFAPLSVVYHDDGTYDHCIWHEREIDVVLADSEILFKQPARLLASGILDAMAKYIEISNGKSELSLSNASLPLLTASHMAEFIYSILTQISIPAICKTQSNTNKNYVDVSENISKEEIEYTIFLNIALTGIVSGMTKGKGQTSVAHAFYNSIRTYFPKESSYYLHGEIVAVGTIAQLVFNGCEKDIPQFKKYMSSMNMPCSLHEMGISLKSDDLKLLYKNISEKRFMIHDNLHESRLKKALREVL